MARPATDRPWPEARSGSRFVAAPATTSTLLLLEPPAESRSQMSAYSAVDVARVSWIQQRGGLGLVLLH
jgi:hypothetical protein